MKSDRRIFLKQSFLGMAGIGIAAPFFIKSKIAEALFTQHALSNLAAADPVFILNGAAQSNFSGDQPSRAHQILWDKENYIRTKGGIPAPSEKVSVIIVGGGIAGLTSAYRLRDLKPVLLEQASQFGGNSKAEQWESVAYSIGAAYIATPEADSESAKMLKELGLFEKIRIEKGDEISQLYKNEVKKSFWQGSTDPLKASEFQRVYKKLLEINENSYPTIPPTSATIAKRDSLNAWDRLSLSEWMAKELGSVHPHIEELFEEYCWSAFAGTASEVSAAQALSFICSDLSSVAALPGGNAAIAQALYLKLQSDFGSRAESALRPGAFVIDISHSATGVRVCYEQTDGKLVTLEAAACVVSSPKFVSQVLIGEMPADQRSAMQALQYRAYVVANILLQNPVVSPAYDLFVIKGEKAIAHSAGDKAADDRLFTDMTFATWALGTLEGTAPHAVLSLFKPFPYDGARQELYKPSAYNEMKARFEKEIPDLLKGLGIPQTVVTAVRTTRWGHAIPLAQKGLIANGTLEKASQPIGGRIFFGQQDNWANPCFETAVSCATQASDQARSIIQAGVA